VYFLFHDEQEKDSIQMAAAKTKGETNIIDEFQFILLCLTSHISILCQIWYLQRRKFVS